VGKSKQKERKSIYQKGERSSRIMVGGYFRRGEGASRK
jgi:hypothetical protein